ncbi:MAG: di-heme oxidoredictase family protein [Planctomycetota bacterium]
MRVGLLSMTVLCLSLAPVLIPEGPEDDPRFQRGKALFDQAFHIADGVGAPEMNADSCRACHQDPVMGGAGPLELNVSRFATDYNGVGPFTDLPGGQLLSKLYPPHEAGREEYVPSEADVFEQRQTPSILGDGLIETIPDAVILANEDPSDSDGDGIYGVARRISVLGSTEVGRFGWKAQVPNLRDFVLDAMFGELGMTTPGDGRGFGQRSDIDSIADPEIDDAQVDDIAFFMQNLPAPQRGGSIDPLVAAGEVLFESIGCAVCHVPELQGTNGPVPLYSNLLLHNVMPADYRGMAEPGAGVGMFRTPPLWGIKDTAPYMHDGRAEDLADSILHHFGEALDSRDAYIALTPSEQAALILFLEDL